MTVLPKIDTKKENKKIISFIKKTFNQNKIKKAIIGLSGGVDSALTLSLITKAIGAKNTIVLYMPYQMPLLSFRDSNLKLVKKLVNKFHIKNFYIIPIHRPVDKLTEEITTAGMTIWQKLIFGAKECFTCPNISNNTKIRFGNLMARTRMTLLYDFAKKYNGLVVGTENKSEHLLGYFTRFGDQASDIEPIIHLYKTNIYDIARYLKLPKELFEKKPSANLWPGQTDEADFGFSYQEADQTLYLTYDRRIDTKKIKKYGLKNTNKILKRVKDNQFKHIVPYHL